jgi:hypothetical protein
MPFRSPSTRLLAAAALAATVAAPARGQPAEARRTRDAIVAATQGPAGAATPCRLFTPDEIQGFFGAKVAAGQSGAGGMGCSWAAVDDGIVIVTVAHDQATPRPSGTRGFKALPALGPRAWVAPSLGWSAGTEEGKTSIYVNASGKTASEAGTVALLQETIRRSRR